jgi:Reverse transcriptase (RNA-dependent DNA polymerase)
VKNSRAYPGADVYSDHNLVMAKVGLRLKKLTRRDRKKKWNMIGLDNKKGQFQRAVELEIKKEKDYGVRGINEDWSQLKEAITIGAKEVYGFQKARIAKKPWITSEMLLKMDERRNWKNNESEYGQKEYSRLNNDLRRTTDKARNQWWNDKCDELAEYDKRGRSDLLYQEVRQLTRTGKKLGTKNITINNKDGELKTELNEVKERWREYVEDLYDKAGKPVEGDFELEEENMVENDQKGPDIMKEEIYEAIKCMKKGKAAGIDDVPAEFLKMLEGETLNKLVELCMKVYSNGVWPDDFTKSVMIPIPKKANAVECSDYRTISLISHASKILLKIINNRIQSKADMVLSKTQFGFRKGCGTREAIGVMRVICERSLEHGNDVFICFVDFEKAFDRIDWVMMLKILRQIGVDWRDRRLILNLYMNQKAVVKIQQEFSEEGEIGRGVRQGCCMSPLLFNIYAEAMMVEAMEGIEEGIKIGGKLLKDVRFADDQGMVAGSEFGLQKIMDGLNATALKYGMKINIKKTKVMRVSREGEVNITINGTKLEQVKSFKYLGHTITDDGRCETEIKCRIAQAKEAFGNRKELLTKSLKKATKIKIVKTLVWTTLLYGSETWTLRKEDIRKLEALEMWLWRRMEKISWTYKITNEEVLERVGTGRQLINALRNRKKSWIGHVLRGDGLLKEVIEGRMEGKRIRGRPRLGMLDDLITHSYVDMKRKTEDREKWRSYMPWTCH